MELAKLGIRAVVVGTDRFEALARSIATSLGAPWLPVVTVGHPVGGIDEQEVLDKIDEVEERLHAALTDGTPKTS